MLILLLATCKQTQLVLEAAANTLDSNLTTDLAAMIERTESELDALTQKIQASQA
jgi:outer membrane murein-binding lipoprotein Lpp